MHGPMKRHEIQVLSKAGHTDQQVADITGVPTRSVRRIKAEPPVAGFDAAERTKERRVGRPPKVEAYRPFVTKLLADEPDLLTLEVLRRARLDGYNGGKSQFYTMVAQLRPKEVRPLVRFEGLPGEFSQHDFGQVDVRYTDGSVERIHFFASRLKWSRHAEVSIVPNQQVEPLVRSIVEHFDRIGGVPLLAVFDRPKTVALKWKKDGTVTEWNPVFSQAMAELSVAAEVCWPYRGQEKAYVSYCTSSVTFDGVSCCWVPPPQLSLVLQWCAVAQVLIQELVLVIVGVRSQQSRAPPYLDGAGYNVHSLGDLGKREESPLAEPFVARLEVVVALKALDHEAVEWLLLTRHVAALIEDDRDLTRRMLIEQPVDLLDDFALGFAEFACRQRPWQCNRLGRASLKANMCRDSFWLGESDVLDHEPNKTLALPHRRFGTTPDPRKVGCKAEDLTALLGGRRHAICPSLPLGEFLCLSQFPQLVVPLRFERRGHQTIIWVDLHEATTRQLGFVSAPFDVLPAQSLRLLAAGTQFILHRKRGLEGQWGNGLDHELADGFVDGRAGNALTHRLTLLHGLH